MKIKEISTLNEYNVIGSAMRLDEIPREYRVHKVLGRGATSIILDYDASHVLMFTKDSMKKDWLVNGLEFAEQMDVVSSRGHHIPALKEVDIYVLKVPKLYKLDPNNRKRVTRFINEYNAINRKVPMSRNKNQEVVRKYLDHIEEFEEMFDSEHHFKKLMNFLADYDSNQYYFDLGTRNFMQTADGKIVVSDPIVSSEIIDAIRDHKRSKYNY